MSYEIIAIIIGPLVAIFTVYLEYIKDKKEKLQDRKDIWLDTHYKELCEELNNLIKCITTKNKVTHEKELETSLVEYECNITSINANMKNTINDITKNYDNAMKHLKRGYKDYYNNIFSIFCREGEYKEQLNETIDEIFKCIKKLMNSKFPSLKPGPKPLDGPNDYDINLIYYKLVENIIEGNVKVNASNYYIVNFLTTYLYFDEPLYRITCNIFQNNEQIDAVLDDFKYVWLQLNKKFETKIKNLNTICKELRDNEEDIKSSLQKIINDFKSGHVIWGYCDMCDKIYHEKDIKKLRPKV